MKKTVLVVDDDASVRESVQKVLRDAGYEVLLAAGGLEAVVRFDTHKTDLVLLDIGLPNQNGREICQHLVSEHPHVPVILITGQAGQFNSALAAGAAALMEKPLDVDQLLQLAQKLLAASNKSAPFPSNGTFYHFAA